MTAAGPVFLDHAAATPLRPEVAEELCASRSKLKALDAFHLRFRPTCWFLTRVCTAEPPIATSELVIRSP